MSPTTCASLAAARGPARRALPERLSLRDANAPRGERRASADRRPRRDRRTRRPSGGRPLRAATGTRLDVLDGTAASARRAPRRRLVRVAALARHGSTSRRPGHARRPAPSAGTTSTGLRRSRASSAGSSAGSVILDGDDVAASSSSCAYAGSRPRACRTGSTPAGGDLGASCSATASTGLRRDRSSACATASARSSSSASSPAATVAATSPPASLLAPEADLTLVERDRRLGSTGSSLGTDGVGTVLGWTPGRQCATAPAGPARPDPAWRSRAAARDGA